MADPTRGGLDADHDGIPDPWDDDIGNDGVPDQDTDGDGVPDDEDIDPNDPEE